MTKTRRSASDRPQSVARLFILEDEVFVAEAIGAYLSTRFGRDVRFVGTQQQDSDDLLRRLHVQQVSIVIIDVNLLPGTSHASEDEYGIAAAHRIRREFGSSIGIILMSRNQRYEERIDEIPADCFVSKLAPLDQLANAVDALRKGRPPARSTSRLAVDGLMVELSKHEVRLAQGDRCSAPVRLQPAPMVLLAYLARERLEFAADPTRQDGRWMIGGLDGGIKCLRGEIWDRDSAIVGAKARHHEISAAQVTNWKFKINDELKSFARIEIIKGPPPGPRSHEMPFELAFGVRGDRITVA